MRENSPSDEPRLLIAKAITLLDDTFAALVDSARWCKRTYAKDAEGDPIKGAIIEAVGSHDVSRPSVFSELLHQGLAHGYRIEIATGADPTDQIANEVRHAPASWMLAAVTLANAAISLNEEHERGVAERRGELGRTDESR